VHLLQVRLRVGARLDPLRDHRRDHRDPDRRQPALRLLRRGAAMSQATPMQSQGPGEAVAPLVPLAPRRWWRPPTGNPLGRAVYLALLAFCTFVFLYPFAWA